MPHARTVYVNCPFCKGMLEINTENGRVVRSFEPKEIPEDGDLLSEGLKAVKGGEATRDRMFREAQEKEKHKLERLERAFKEKKKEVVESGDISRPESPFDME
ncbi:MAG: hypothetical protein WCP22_05355 [Chlamydiota bacterium]